MAQNVVLNNNIPLLKDTFKYLKNDKIHVQLHAESIKMYNSNKETQSEFNADAVPNYTFAMADIVGCSISKAPKQKDQKAYLTIYSYPRTSASNIKRKRTVLELEYSNHDTYERNLECVQEWSVNINKILSRSLNEKPFLVYINPNSGAGKAKTLFLERIKPVWAEANIPHAVVITKHANHAFEHVQKLDLNEIRGILVVSGDGLVYEIINGLMSRPDWKDAMKTPIGQLPGGSGNALSSSICHIIKEEYHRFNLKTFAMHMGFLTLKYDVLPMDLVAMDISIAKESKGNSIISERKYSFLSTEWAIVADVDYESEKYRYLGGLRFTIAALVRIMNLIVYRGRISFLPSSGSFTPKNSSLNIKQQPKDQANVRTESLTELSTNGVVTKYLKPLNEPVPNDWVVIEDNFVLVLIIQKPLIGQDFVAWSDAKLDNGEMLLVFIKEGITKMQLLKLFGEAETGAYLKNELVESVKIKAFRIEPLVENGYLMVDGEHVPYGPIQGEIMEAKLNCIAKKSES